MDINATLLGQAITFAILVWFTMKFVWPPLSNMLEERAKRIADGLAAGEAGKQELLNAEAKVASELKKVQLRANTIINNAEKRSEQIVEEAKSRAKHEAERILLDAKAQIDQEFMRVKEQLRNQVATLALQGAEQILRSEINAEQHHQLLTRIQAEL